MIIVHDMGVIFLYIVEIIKYISIIHMILLYIVISLALTMDRGSIRNT
jgi:hypothetical protein